MTPGSPPRPLLPETGTVTVDGCPIRWFAGGRGAPTLVLVHGGGAHSGWWEPMLTELAARQRVVMLDLAGHGDSGWRPGGYPVDLWVADIVAVIERVTDGSVALVGHSFAGRLCTSVAARRPELVESLVTVDAIVSDRDEVAPRVRPQRFYDSKPEILAAFRLMPPQRPPAPDVMARLACRSIRQATDRGWTWKFDPSVFGQIGGRLRTMAEIPGVRCPVTIVIAENSTVMRPEIPTDYVRALGRPAEIVTVAACGHHIPLDKPQELSRVLRRVAGPAPAG